MSSSITRFDIEKQNGNIVQKHGGSKYVGFKQLGPYVETGFHGVQDEKRVWFEVELQGAQGNHESKDFREKVYLGIKVGVDITVTGIPGQVGPDGNIAERKERRSKEAKLGNLLKYKVEIVIDENPIRTLGDYSKPSHKGYMNTIELPVGNNVVLLRSDTIRTLEKVLIREEAKSLVTKIVNSISLIREEEEKNDIYDVAAGDDSKETDGPDMELSVKEAETKNGAENGAENKPIKKAEKDEVVEAPSSRHVEYYLKHRINEKLIEGLVDNNRFNDSLSRARVRKAKGKTYNVLPRGHVYEVILKKKITKKEDIGGNFEIPCNIGGLKHVNALIDQGSDPVDFVILDIKEDKRRPFILETPFLTTKMVVIKFDKGTITLRSRKSKISFHRIPESPCKSEKGIKNNIEPIAPIMTVNMLVLEWEERIKLHLEKEMEFN
nr:hypothetical protein [Tanacetum cinerariifolium]